MKRNCKLILLLLFLVNTSVASISSSPSSWASLEYLHWWTQNSPLGIPLITQNHNPSAFGIINESGTQIILGPGSNHSDLNLNGMNGVRIKIGTWFNSSSPWGVEAGGFGLSSVNSIFTASSVGGNIPIINIPFFDVLNSRENVLVARLPNQVTVSDRFQPWGLELNTLYNLENRTSFPLFFLMGLRYIHIGEDFTLSDAIYGTPRFPNSVFNLIDKFSTRNNFYGFQIGARTHFSYYKLIFEVGGTVSIGENFQKLIINGEFNQDGSRVIQRIGLFAEPTNIGTFYHQQWAIMPELNTKVGFDINTNVHPFIAYNFLYFSDILRPGKAIDRNINKSQNPQLGGTGLVGPRVPIPKFNNTGLWMQGLSAGIEFTF